MAVALVAIIAIGLLGSVSPSTLVVFILLLFTARPTGNAVGFLFGWALSLVVVFSIVFAASGAASLPHSGGHTLRPDVSEACLATLRGRLTQLGPMLVASVSLLVSAFLVAAGLLAFIGG